MNSGRAIAVSATIAIFAVIAFLYTASLYKLTGSIVSKQNVAYEEEVKETTNHNPTNTSPILLPEKDKRDNASTAQTKATLPATEVQPNSTKDKCGSLSCQKSVVICPDGTRATCRNFCMPDTGLCTDCTPECGSIQPSAGSTSPPLQTAQPKICTENWNCTLWGECKDSYRKRDCSDANSCRTNNTKPLLIEQCQQKEEPAAIKIISIQADSPGDDRKRENWNGEWVLIEGFAADMTGYTLSDSSNHTYSFPDSFMLAGRVKLYSGDGNNTRDELYWNEGRRPIWNNDKDKATLRDRNGNIVTEYEYG